MRLQTKENRRGQFDFSGGSTPSSSDPVAAALLEMKALKETDFAKIHERRQSSYESFGSAAISLGLITEEALNLAIDLQRNVHVLAPNDPRLDRRIVTAFDPDDFLSEAVRALRSKITGARDADGNRLRLVACLGLENDVKASIFTANLATALAQAGYRTLLVDANPRTGMQDRLFRVSNKVGLTTLLSQTGDASAALQATAVTDLSILTFGPDVSNANELFDRARLFKVIRPLIERFDFILVDSSNSPLELATTISEGFDSTIIVINKHVAYAKRLDELIKSLRARGTDFIGSVIVN